MNITIVTSFSKSYYLAVAQYGLKTWDCLLGQKIAISDDGFDPHLPDLKIVSGLSIFDPRDPYWSETGKKHKFWKKGMSVAWLAENITTDYMLWLDGDVTVLKPFDYELYKPNDNEVATFICPDGQHAETGFVFLNRQHPQFLQWLKEYKSAWYNGVIDRVRHPWDGYIFYETIKNYPSRNISFLNVRKPQGFEDTPLLDYMFHYSGKRKNLLRDNK